MTYTQTKTQSGTDAQFINIQQVPAQEALAHLQALVEAGSVIAFTDPNGFMMFQSEEVLVSEACHSEWKERTSLRRNCAGRKNKEGKSGPVTKFITSSGLEGNLWGGFSLDIPVDS
tara:strand:- start:650 stop:997 length:348 start_codon:yes stop_codon:yes gene_type:complete